MLYASRSLVLLVALSACSVDAPSQEASTDPDAEASAPEGSWGEDAFIDELHGRLETARDKFIAMAEAVPEDAWDYRPMQGVRSFGEVFIHVAADNWAPGWAVIETTMESPIGRSAEALAAYQAEARPKADTLAELERSFAFLLESLEASRGELDQRVMFGGREWELGEMWIALATHMHEHLGQSIAYARANEIVPPWSG